MQLYIEWLHVIKYFLLKLRDIWNKQRSCLVQLSTQVRAQLAPLAVWLVYVKVYINNIIFITFITSLTYAQQTNVNCVVPYVCTGASSFPLFTDSVNIFYTHQ